jgi:hypothetical protein
MAGVLDYIKDQIDPATIDRISNEIGEDPATTKRAVDASVPLLAGAISTQEAAQATGDAAAQPARFGGLGDTIAGAGGAPGAGGIGGALGGMLGGAGGGMLESILGGSKSSVQDDIAKQSGVNPQKVMRILTMLAPIVFAAYTKHRNADQSPPAPGRTTEGGGGILGDIIDRVT